jgi:hypothetical protein
MSLLHSTDNKAVAVILSYGSRNPRLQKMVRGIYLTCERLGISFMAEWRLRSDPLMLKMDLGTRTAFCSPANEFGLSFDSFMFLLD